MSDLKPVRTREPQNAGLRKRYARLEKWLYFSAVGGGIFLIGVVCVIKILGIY